jgi:uncharacterized protein (TIGR02466 family)
MLNLWSTYIHQFEQESFFDLNRKIEKYLLEQEQNKTESGGHSLIGKDSWHSDSNLTSLDNEWSRSLKQIIERNCVAYLQSTGVQTDKEVNANTACWAMIMRGDAQSQVHCHPGADLSGVYYVKVPEENPGNLCFLDPRPGAKNNRIFQKDTKMIFKPREGLGLVFPSWVDHYVEPHNTKGTRISISFNFYII